MAEERSKHVKIACINDKWQITAVFTNTTSEDFLPLQIIHSGKNQRCVPSVEFPDDWHVTYTQNHWANEVTTENYIKTILLPYVVQKKSELSLPDDHPALVIYAHLRLSAQR